MHNDIVRITQAFDFAARKHIHQRRKGELQEPYVNHLSEVALLLAEATAGEDANLIIAGLLHDTIEDQGVTQDEIAAIFGEDVASLVVEVTDDKSLAKEERKRLQAELAATKSVRCKLLKIADKTANLRSMQDSPPSGWSEERKREYFVWSKSVVDNCRGVNAWLEQKFDIQYKFGEFAMTTNVSLPTDDTSEYIKRLVSQVETMVKQSGTLEGFDAERWVIEWLHRPLPALGDKKPAELMGTKEGREIVSGILARIQSGAYA